MKTMTAILATVVTFAAGQVLALTPEEVAADLTAQGYERIEIRTRAGTIKVEAIRGTEKLEVIYDAGTGAVLKTETETVDAGDDTTPGVTIRQKRSGLGRAHAEDHSRGRSQDDGSENDDNDDHGRGHDDGADHDSVDDHGRGRGSDDGADHDKDDDHGERRGQGNDD